MNEHWSALSMSGESVLTISVGSVVSGGVVTSASVTGLYIDSLILGVNECIEKLLALSGPNL